MDPTDVTLEAQLNPKKILPQTKGWSEEKGVLQALWSLFGGLSSRGRRQRRGGDAAPSCSGDLPKVPYFDPRGGGPPPGVGGKRRSACHVGLLLRPAHWPIQVCGMAPHRTARSPRTASFAHHFTLITCRCTVPQVAAMDDRQHRPEGVRGLMSLQR